MKKYLKWVEIDKSNLIHNVREFRKIVGSDIKLFSVIKANAYGHGLLEVADIIKGEIYGFAVNHLDEALALRNSGIENPILVIGYILKNRLVEAVENDISFCVYNKEAIDALGEILDKECIPDQVGGDDSISLTTGTKAKVHIKVDTGLSRQGVFPEDVLDFVKYIRKVANIEIEGIYTHYANIEDTTDHSYAQKQLETFEKVLYQLEQHNIDIPTKHSACTAATVLFPKTYFNAVRVGIGTYGLWSSNETKVTAANLDRLDIELKPAMTWKTRVAQVKWLEPNTPVAYGLAYFTTRKTKVAILPVGYSDGYDFRLANNSYVVIKGRRCAVLGRVMMNTIVVDVTEVEDVRPEDEVILLGYGGMLAEEMASKAGTLNYEIVTKINWDLPRIVV